MATFTVVMRPEDTGWATYAAVFSPDGDDVWDGAAFVPEDNDAIADGAVDGVERDGEPGTYDFETPEGITAVGTYPVRAYRRIGGARDPATDWVLTPDIPQNVVTIATGAVEIEYTPGERAAGTPEVVTYPRGSGLPIRATPATPTPVDGDKKEIRVGVPGLSGSYDAFNVADGNLTGDFTAGELVANPTAAQSAAWSLVGTLRVEVWHVDGAGNTYPEAIYRLDLQGTLYDAG